MTREQQQEIIDLVVKIFQNVGIKRWIDKIDILKNYQIYFEICKVIFPQTMIQLLRFSEGSQSNAEKIQGVIDIVGKILQNDLYHISGEAIAEGKLSHIRNFLHILQLLSENVHKGNRDDESVESAPENTKSFLSDYDQQGHYTVIGIDKEFSREYDEQYGYQKQSKSEQEQETKREFQNKNKNHQKEDLTQFAEDSQSERPMNPVLDKKQQSPKKKFVKSKAKPQKEKDRPSQTQKKSKPHQKPNLHSYKRPNTQISKLQDFVKRREPKTQTKQRFKSQFVRKINNIIEDFEAKKLTDLKLEYNIWVKVHEMKTSQKQNRIEEQNRQRMQLANDLIIQRKKKINTLRNAKQAVGVMANLFKEQRNIWKGMKRAKEESQLQTIEALIQGDQTDEYLLRQALMAGNPQNNVPKKGKKQLCE